MTWARAAVGAGALSALGLLLSPTVLPSAPSDVILPGVLPLGFFAAGGTAQVLRPGHPVAHRLLAVGVLHLTALLVAVFVPLAPGAGIAAPVAWLSAVLYALGFVALLDLLARYPSGGYAWPLVRTLVPSAAAAAVVAAT